MWFERIKLKDYVDSLRESDLAAVTAAKAENDRRLDGMNELRDQINIERTTYLPRALYEERHEALIDKVEIQFDSLKNEISTLSKSKVAEDAIHSDESTRKQYRWMTLAILSTFFGVVLNIILKLVGIN